AGALAGALASRRLAPPLGAAGALFLLAWPVMQFPSQLWMPFAYLLLGAGALALARPLPAAVRWTALFSNVAAALGALTLMFMATMRDAAQTDPWAAGGLALGTFALGAAQWHLGRQAQRTDTQTAGLVVAVALLVAWPFLQFESSLWQTFTLVVAAAGLCCLAAAWGSVDRTMRGVAAIVTGVAAVSLLVLNLTEHAARDEPWGAGPLAAVIFGLGGAVWWLGQKKETDSATPVAGLVVAGAMLFVWPFLQFPDSLWQTFTLGTAGLGLLLGGFAYATGRRTMQVFAAAAGAVALGSLFVLAVAQRAVNAYPLDAGGIAVLVAALGLGLWWTGKQSKDPAIRPPGLAVAAVAPALYLGFLLDGWGIAVAWAVEGLALAAAGIVLRDMHVRIAAFATFGLVLGRIFLVDFQSLDLPFRVLTFICTGAVLLLAAYLFARQRKEPAGPTPP
ncbi:MAG: DUF2339 domain-containing protein, partial [Thermoplasmatota archaeon]